MDNNGRLGNFQSSDNTRSLEYYAVFRTVETFFI